MRLLTLAVWLLALSTAGCGGPPAHGVPSALTARSAAPEVLCEHRVPKDVCTRCHPELADRHKAMGDWCRGHDVPESQCLICHPGLTFEAPPEIPAAADRRAATQAEVEAGLPTLAVPGKVTLVDVWAVWCVPCRNVEVHLAKRLAAGATFAVRTIEIRDWSDPLAERLLGGASELPLLVVFDAAGKERGRLTGFKPDELDALLSAAGGP